MANGTVKFFNAAKGFGFITPGDGGKDVFVPTASIASSGLAGLKPGQRLSFETVPDAKGPKAVELKLIAGEPVQEAPRKAPPPPPRPPAQPVKPSLTIYMDPSSELATDALEELQEAGFEPRIVDYIATPPSREQLKALSLLLRDGDQSLVRRYDSLFLELQLDDRFISDTEYWGAVHEHPSLINGPVLVTPTRARVCRTESAVKDFMATMGGGTMPTTERPKRLPDGIQKLVKDAPAAAAVEEPPVQEEEEAPAPKAKAPRKAAAKPADKAEPKPAAKKTVRKAAPKPAEKKPVKAKKK